MFADDCAHLLGEEWQCLLDNPRSTVCGISPDHLGSLPFGLGTPIEWEVLVIPILVCGLIGGLALGSKRHIELIIYQVRLHK